MKKKVLTGLLAATVLIASLGMAGCGSGGDEKDAAANKGSVVIAGSTSVQPLSEAMAEVYMDSNPDVTVEVQGGGSGQMCIRDRLQKGLRRLYQRADRPEAIHLPDLPGHNE